MGRIKLETEHKKERCLRRRKSSPQSECYIEVNPLPPRCLSRPQLLYKSEMESDALQNVRWLCGGCTKMGQNSSHNKCSFSLFSFRRMTEQCLKTGHDSLNFACCHFNIISLSLFRSRGNRIDFLSISTSGLYSWFEFLPRHWHA
jgi:hypothetical protein